MQLNNVIKIIVWYLAIVALLIQTDTTENITDAGISIGALLFRIHHYNIINNNK